MIGLGHLLVLIAGGTAGFVLASIVACNRLAYLTEENKRLNKEIERYQRAFEVAVEENQISNKPSLVNEGAPLTELKTVTEG
jgi:hypothetical protein